MIGWDCCFTGGWGMVESPQSLFAFLDIAVKAKRYRDLRGAILDRPVVRSKIWGITLLDKQQRMIDIAGRNVTDSFLSSYEDGIRFIDPILKAVVERHMPSHNMMLGPPDSWHRQPMYRELMRPAGLEHVMHAPVVGDGNIVATLHFVREEDDLPFGAMDVSMASAMANHVSALLARFDFRNDEMPLLTRRELEVARLVAAGLNNREIAQQLGISRNTVKEVLKNVFRKLEVDARAEMAARLTAARVL